MIRTAKHPCTITIFEGPDGGGKSTMATEYADSINARYVHFPAVKKIHNLSRIYVEAAMPALNGEYDVVFDRSWLSEGPYGNVFRHGLDRVGSYNRRMLERLFMRCGAVVVKCLPEIDVCLSTFRSRRDQEMLEDELQLRQVHDEYARLECGLPTVNHDYTRANEVTKFSKIQARRFTRHPVSMKSVGNFDGQIIIVGPGIHDHNDYNCFSQFPFVDFAPIGKVVTNLPPESELTRLFESYGIPESELLWIDDSHAHEIMDIFTPNQLVGSKFFAVGDKAINGLYRSKLPAFTVDINTSGIDIYNYLKG